MASYYKRLFQFGISSIAVFNSQSIFLKDKDEKCFIWGNGHYQARPDVSMQFQNFTPKEIKEFEKVGNVQIKDFTFGKWHTGAIDANGNLHIWSKHVLTSFPDSTKEDNKRSNIVTIKGSFVEVQFTKGFVWALNKNGDVLQFQIEKQISDNNEIISAKVNTQARQIKSLPPKISHISCGEDHFVALTEQGQVFTMGDDTFGQCGQGAGGRGRAPPFSEKRIRNPNQIENLPRITKIVSGHNHVLAISEDGICYGWGSNSKMQLSQEMEFSKLEDPLLAVYTPIRITKKLEQSVITDIAAGEAFSVLVTKNKVNDETEVFSCGHNVRGELGIGYLRHIADVTKIEALSNYKIQNKGQQVDIKVKQIQCGAQHCMALLNIGTVTEWGCNEYGQLGNKKRVFSESPIILNYFKNQNIKNINCGYANSAIITEDNEEKK